MDNKTVRSSAAELHKKFADIRKLRSTELSNALDELWRTEFIPITSIRIDGVGDQDKMQSILNEIEFRQKGEHHALEKRRHLRETIAFVIFALLALISAISSAVSARSAAIAVRESQAASVVSHTADDH